MDPVRGKTALEWAFLTDSFDTVQRIRQLLRRPQVEQLSQHYQPEWPALPGLVAQAQAAPSLLEPFSPPDRDRRVDSPRGLEGVPGLPGAPQHEAGLTKKFVDRGAWQAIVHGVAKS